MQWWSWAGKNSDSCVPSQTRPKGGKQKAVGKGWGWGTGLQGDNYKTLNFPTTERNEGPCSLLASPPPTIPGGYRNLRCSGLVILSRVRQKQGKSEGAEAAKRHQPRALSCPTDSAHPGLERVLHKMSILLPARERTQKYLHTQTHGGTYTETRGWFVQARKWDGAGGEIYKNCLQSLLSNSLRKGLNPWTHARSPMQRLPICTLLGKAPIASPQKPENNKTSCLQIILIFSSASLSRLLPLARWMLLKEASRARRIHTKPGIKKKKKKN